jgi:endonuclease/exonuclease/phosphatase family metal-dependent hydrolase
MLAGAEPRPRVVLGDLNQMIPRKYAPQELFEQLASTLAGHSIVTEGIVPGGNRETVDHVAVSQHLCADEVRALPAGHEGRHLSDHFGIFARLKSR